MIWLIFAHFIGDFALQKEWVALNKGKYWYLMIAHCMIWTACICVALMFYFNEVTWIQILFLFSIHYSVDKWKCWATKDFPTWHFYIDQAIHLCQCLIVFAIGLGL